MPAADHRDEVLKGIKAAFNGADDLVGRCKNGGELATSATVNGIPIIKEWQFAEGSVIAFSKIDSCLGVVQIVDQNSIRGAHFSMFASGQQFDVVQFTAAMKKAGFVEKKGILYFGGGVDEWKTGLAASAFIKAGPFLYQVDDAEQKCWIFEMSSDVFTSYKM